MCSLTVILGLHNIEAVLEWISKAWEELPNDVVKKSFKACGLTTAIDGSGDFKVACFKDGGSIGTEGLDVLHKLRTTAARLTDGRHDSEDDGDEEILV